MPDKDIPTYMEFDERSPAFQVHILALRVDVLTREKEDIEAVAVRLEQRVANMEKSFQRGAGAAIMLPIIGTALGFIFMYGKIIFGNGK